MMDLLRSAISTRSARPSSLLVRILFTSDNLDEMPINRKPVDVAVIGLGAAGGVAVLPLAVLPYWSDWVAVTEAVLASPGLLKLTVTTPVVLL